MDNISLWWTGRHWEAQVEPWNGQISAPGGWGKTSAAAVADLIRQDPTARGLAVKMAPKGGTGVKEAVYMPAPHFGR